MATDLPSSPDAVNFPRLPFDSLVGIELVSAERDEVKARLEWAPERCTAGNALHGGALMSLADTCGAICAALNLPEGAQTTATIESKTNFLRTVRGGSVTATSRPIHRGRTLIVVETEVDRDDGKLAAKTTQTQAFLYP